jgi:hypothetical protein
MDWAFGYIAMAVHLWRRSVQELDFFSELYLLLKQKGLKEH